MKHSNFLKNVSRYTFVDWSFCFAFALSLVIFSRISLVEARYLFNSDSASFLQLTQAMRLDGHFFPVDFAYPNSDILIGPNVLNYVFSHFFKLSLGMNLFSCYLIALLVCASCMYLAHQIQPGLRVLLTSGILSLGSFSAGSLFFVNFQSSYAVFVLTVNVSLGLYVRACKKKKGIENLTAIDALIVLSPQTILILQNPARSLVWCVGPLLLAHIFFQISGVANNLVSLRTIFSKFVSASMLVILGTVILRYLLATKLTFIGGIGGTSYRLPTDLSTGMQLAFNATSWILGITPSSGGRLVSLAAALSMIHLVFYLLLSYVICKSFRSLNPSNRVVLIVGLSSVIFGIYQLSYTGLGVNNDSARYLIPGFWVLLLLGIALGMSKLSHYNLWVARFFVPILSLAICFGNFHQVLLVDKKPFQNRQKVIDFLRIDPLPVGIAGYWSSALLEAQSDFSISMYPVLPDQANCFVPYYWLINKEKILNFPKQYWIVLTNSEYLDFENSLSCNKLLKSKIKQIKKFEDFTLLKI